jgi:hypothetical protein
MRRLKGNFRERRYLPHFECWGLQFELQQSEFELQELPSGMQAATLVRGVAFFAGAITLLLWNDRGATAPSANDGPVLWLKKATTHKPNATVRENPTNSLEFLMACFL